MVVEQLTLTVMEMDLLIVMMGVQLIPAHFESRGEMVLNSLIRTAPRMQGQVIIITAGVDGQHSEGSLHWLGLGLDFRFIGWRNGAIWVPGPPPAKDQEADHGGADRADQHSSGGYVLRPLYHGVELW